MHFQKDLDQFRSHSQAHIYSQKYIFAAGYRGVYDFFKAKPDDKEANEEEDIFNIITTIKKNFSISSDKKTALITVSYSDNDRAFPPKMVNAFLRDASGVVIVMSYLPSTSI